MRGRVLLVLPIREGDNFVVAPDLGILVLGTALFRKGFDVTLLDCPKEGMTYGGFRSYLESKTFDVVGFRCFSRDHNYVRRHLEIVRQVSPGAITLAGGPHPSALPEFVLDSMPGLDFAWKAEAEEGLPRLLSLVEERGRNLPDELLGGIPGLAWRSAALGRSVVNPPAFTADLDACGIPEWELIRPDTYPGLIYDEYYPLLTTRGCTFPCTYCNTPGLSGRKLRHRRLDLVMEELAFLKKRYGIRRFSIADDEFTLDRNYAFHFCEELIRSGLKLSWDCPIGVRLDSLDPALVQTMEKAGCECIAVGIESGSERIQKLIRKNVTLPMVRERAAMVARSSRIKLIGYFMIGFPDETEAEVLQTIRLAAELPLHRANFNLVIPIPGTALFEEAIRNGRRALQDINWDAYTSDQVSFSRNRISAKRLLALNRRAYLRFYGRPRVLGRLLRESFTNRQIIRASLRSLKRLFTPRGAQAPLYLTDPQ